MFDGSVAGMDGCPYAQGAIGNVTSEYMLYLLNGVGIHTGVDLDKLIVADQRLCVRSRRTIQNPTSDGSIPHI